MIFFMMNFLSKKEKDSESITGIKTDNRLSIINEKQKRINNFLNNSNGLFNQRLQRIFEKLDLVSYIELPLEKDLDYNNYPFGNQINLD